jgi:hypothetical protein
VDLPQGLPGSGRDEEGKGLKAAGSPETSHPVAPPAPMPKPQAGLQGRRKVLWGPPPSTPALWPHGTWVG